MDSNAIIEQVCQSSCFKAEAKWLARSGFEVGERPRLFKFLENKNARLIYPTHIDRVEEGVAVGLVCLYDGAENVTVYAHAIFAGPGVNASLRNLFVPATQVKPQPGLEGNKAILKFIAWKQAAWSKFINDELELGVEQASAIWMANLWKALDRMYGGNNLLEASN